MENLSDIVAEMRRNGDAWSEDRSTNKTECLGLITLKYADRIEAAWKREKAEIEADALAVGGVVEASRHSPGNAAALREAIEPWVAFGEWLLENAGKEGLGAAIREYGPIIRQRLEELRAVLAKPPRNCDVGTPEDQEKRYKLKREVYHTLTLTNALAWAQTPYEAQEGGAE